MSSLCGVICGLLSGFSVTKLTTILQQVTSRYRTALVTKAALVAVLCLGSVGTLTWRLQALRLPGVVSLGGPSLLALVAVLSLAWWLRRRWISAEGGAAYLDDALGLQQRLITAAEFAAVPQAPALYPLLVEDTLSRCQSAQVRFPRPLDRTTGVLLLLLLLLVLWPGRGSALKQLAQLPQHLPSPPPGSQPPTPPPPQDQRQKENRASAQQAASSGSQGPSSTGGGGASQSTTQAGGAPPSSPASQQGGTSQQTTGGQGRGAAQEHDTQSSKAGSGQRDSTQASAGAQSASSGAQPGAQSTARQAQASQSPASSPQQGQGQSSTGQTQASKSSEVSPQQGQSSTGAGQAKQGQRGKGAAKGSAQHAGTPQSASARGTSQEARGTQGSRQGQQQVSGSSSRPSESGVGNAAGAGDQEALKAEIQQLLKEVSGELKQLQAQLASAKDQPQPAPGTSADPNLYEAPSPLERAATGPSLPMQLQTDTGKTVAPRPGSGVGAPGTPASSARPQTQPEAAELSNIPLEEQGVARQVVPPEYRSVFERLNRQQSKPSETTK